MINVCAHLCLHFLPIAPIADSSTVTKSQRHRGLLLLPSAVLCLGNNAGEMRKDSYETWPSFCSPSSGFQNNF